MAINKRRRYATRSIKVIGLFVSRRQFLGKAGVEFDARKFQYIGVPAQDNYMLGVHKSTGITSIEQWLTAKTLVKFGGVGVGSATDDIPKVLGAAIGLPFQLVSGYKGTADVRLAFNSGEINGICNSWESFKATWSKELSAGEVVIVLQNVAKPHPDQPRLPLAINYAKTEEGQKLIRALVHSVGPTARPYVLPPGTPKDRVQILRKAFIDTVKDPDKFTARPIVSFPSATSSRVRCSRMPPMAADTRVSPGSG